MPAPVLMCVCACALCRRDNGIGERGARELAAILVVNRTLLTADLRRNQIGEEGREALDGVLQNNKSLRTLMIDNVCGACVRVRACVCAGVPVCALAVELVCLSVEL